MSEISEVREVINGTHVMENETALCGLRDYHVAREVVAKSCRVKDPYTKLARVKALLKNYRVRVTLGPVNDVMITTNADGTGLYTVI